MLQAIANLRHIFALYSSQFINMNSRTDKISAGWKQFNKIIYKTDLCLVSVIEKKM